MGRCQAEKIARCQTFNLELSTKPPEELERSICSQSSGSEKTSDVKRWSSWDVHVVKVDVEGRIKGSQEGKGTRLYINKKRFETSGGL